LQFAQCCLRTSVESAIDIKHRVTQLCGPSLLDALQTVRACEEVFQLTLGAEAELVRINAQQLKPRIGSALASELALEVTLHPKDGPANGYIMPPHVAATLAFVWKQGFYEHNCQSAIYNWLYHSLWPQEDQSLHFEGKEPIVHRLITAIDLCNWKPGKALSKGMQACFAAPASVLSRVLSSSHDASAISSRHVLLVTIIFHVFLKVTMTTFSVFLVETVCCGLMTLHMLYLLDHIT
jgi:hypothetical protein